MYGSDWPDIEILTLDAYTGSLNDFILGAPDIKNYTSVCVATVAPFSRGNVTIASNDTNIHPIVNPNWLTDPQIKKSQLQLLSAHVLCLLPNL